MRDYTTWEGEVVQLLGGLLEVPAVEAQRIVDAQENLVSQCFDDWNTPEDTAFIVAAASSGARIYTIKSADGTVKVALEVTQYENDRIALELYEVVTQELWMVPSVNLPDEPLGENQVFIKDWSECGGIMQALVQLRIINSPLETVNAGMGIAYKCDLLVPVSIAH